MKMRFESADEMREKVPVGTKFKAFRRGKRVWSYAKREYVPSEDVYPKRAVLEDERNVFIYNHRSKRYGIRLPIEYFIIGYIADITPAGHEAIAWERRVKNVIKKLDESGLWAGKKEEYERLLQIGFERRERLRELYWNEPWRNSNLLRDVYNKKDGAVEAYNAAIVAHYGELMNEIPFAFYRRDNGLWFLETFYIWEMSEAKTKSMYFGKLDNARIKEEIQRAFDEKRRYTNRARTSYDVSFEYDPERNMAWYSEEYKGCGNGHYYIAIDANTALFCEDD